ncbi:MAG: DUF2156 domain-containing protein [Chitinophagales bacterium]|jgi:hypothetical protein|nr:DUF2156 domain-containing protein [Chitinophagales bacterium]
MIHYQPDFITSLNSQFFHNAYIENIELKAQFVAYFQNFPKTIYTPYFSGIHGLKKEKAIIDSPNYKSWLKPIHDWLKKFKYYDIKSHEKLPLENERIEYNYVVDLTQDYEVNFKSSLSRHIKKNQALILAENSELDFLEPYLSDKASKIAPLYFIKKVYQNNQKHIRGFSLNDEAGIQAQLLIFIYNTEAYYFVGGYHPKSPNGCYPALIARTLSYLKSEGFTYFSFEGSSVESVARFYENFTNKKQSFYRYQNIHPWYRFKSRWL